MASTGSCPIAGMADSKRHFYGIQFHPEVTHTLQGERIFQHFVLDICNCPARWTAAAIIDDQIARVRAQVGDSHVLLGLSGGVDSSVVAALLHRAIGDQIDLRICRQRPVAKKRGRYGDGDVRQKHGR